MPTETHTVSDSQRYFLSTVRQSQAALIDSIRTWTTITEQLTRTFRLPVPDVDFDGIVDRAFNVAEQTLAAQHQLARTLAGVATRQVDTAVETVGTAVAVVETVVDKRLRQVDDLVEAAEAEQDQRDRERPEQPQASMEEASRQDRRPDGRTYEERTVEELRERAGELQVEGRSAMSKDELIAALRNHRKSRSAKSDAAKSQPPKQESQPDRRAYEERSVEDLRDRARELQVEGRSAMSKDELVASLRKQAK
jgi:Rho termination factor, N-terminal domain